jgi:hypothetical protein
MLFSWHNSSEGSCAEIPARFNPPAISKTKRTAEKISPQSF